MKKNFDKLKTRRIKFSYLFDEMVNWNELLIFKNLGK